MRVTGHRNFFGGPSFEALRASQDEDFYMSPHGEVLGEAEPRTMSFR
jgi:hypothetical protein